MDSSFSWYLDLTLIVMICSHVPFQLFVDTIMYQTSKQRDNFYGHFVFWYPLCWRYAGLVHHLLVACALIQRSWNFQQRLVILQSFVLVENIEQSVTITSHPLQKLYPDQTGSLKHARVVSIVTLIHLIVCIPWIIQIPGCLATTASHDLSSWFLAISLATQLYHCICFIYVLSPTEDEAEELRSKEIDIQTMINRPKFRYQFWALLRELLLMVAMALLTVSSVKVPVDFVRCIEQHAIYIEILPTFRGFSTLHAFYIRHLRRFSIWAAGSGLDYSCELAEMDPENQRATAVESHASPHSNNEGVSLVENSVANQCWDANSTTSTRTDNSHVLQNNSKSALESKPPQENESRLALVAAKTNFNASSLRVCNEQQKFQAYQDEQQHRAGIVTLPTSDNLSSKRVPNFSRRVQMNSTDISKLATG